MLFEYQMVGGNKKAEIENHQGFMFHCQNLQSGSPQNAIIMQPITNLLPHVSMTLLIGAFCLISHCFFPAFM